MRVVALTVEASLGVALSMMDDWEVVAAKSIEDAIRLAPTAAVILVGMGGTDEGLAVAQEIYGRGATIPAVVVGLMAFSGESIAVLGLLLLVATPVLRVAISIFAFLYQKDRVFVVITSVVLMLLLLSFMLGKAGG